MYPNIRQQGGRYSYGLKLGYFRQEYSDLWNHERH